MISPYRIKFRNKTNEDFDVIVGASFDSDSGNTASFLNRESTSSNTYDGHRRNVHGYHYTDVLTVSFTLIKQDYTDITDNERRMMYAWLTGSNKVEELVVYKDDSEVVSYKLIGQFINIEHYKLGNGRDVGVVCTFEHIAPYAYSLPKTITKTINTETTSTKPSNINEIYWVEFFLDGNPNTGADATIYVGPEYSGEQVEVSMSYSRNGNYFESEGYNWYTVASDGTIFVRTTPALNKYPDKCEISLSHNGNTITATCPMKKHKGTQKSYPN